MRKAAPAAIVARLMLPSLMLVACARQATLESGGDVDIGATPVDASSLPSGTNLTLRLDQEIGTKVSKVGDTFTATVTEPVMAQNGDMVVPSGTKVNGKVTALEDSERAGDPAVIKIDFETLNLNGRNHPFAAKVTATDLQTRGGDTRDETLRKAGVGAAAGAVLGAVLSGGELDEIIVGGALGAAAGTAISLGTGSQEAVLPAGTEMRVQTTRVVALQQ